MAETIAGGPRSDGCNWVELDALLLEEDLDHHEPDGLEDKGEACRCPPPPWVRESSPFTPPGADIRPSWCPPPPLEKGGGGGASSSPTIPSRMDSLGDSLLTRGDIGGGK